jgi:hypothetical protein
MDDDPPSGHYRSTSARHENRRVRIMVLLVLLGCIATPSQANPDAKRLYDDLLSNYNRLIRPVSNNTDTVLVKLGLRLSQLIDLVSTSYHILHKNYSIEYNL